MHSGLNATYHPPAEIDLPISAGSPSATPTVNKIAPERVSDPTDRPLA